MAERDYYTVLGIERGASADEIKRAYRGLARKLHPDVNKAADATRRAGLHLRAPVEEAVQPPLFDRWESVRDRWESVRDRRESGGGAGGDSRVAGRFTGSPPGSRRAR